MARPVDLPRVRRALNALDRIAAEHPELCQGQGQWDEKEVQRIMGTSAKDRTAAYKARLRGKGYRQISIFISPDAQTVLSRLVAAHPDQSVGETISDVLVKSEGRQS